VGKPVTEIAKAVIQTEADSILLLKDRIDQKFDEACHLLAACKGKVILIGMGKSGHIAKKDCINPILYWHSLILYAPW